MNTRVISSTLWAPPPSSGVPHIWGRATLVEAHPTLPLIAATIIGGAGGGSSYGGSGDRLDNVPPSTSVFIWDYHRNEFVRHFSHRELSDWVAVHEIAISAAAASAQCGKEKGQKASSVHSGKSGTTTVVSSLSGVGVGVGGTDSVGTALTSDASSAGSSGAAGSSGGRKKQQQKHQKSATTDTAASVGSERGGGVAPVKLGPVRSLRFFDRHSLLWDSGLCIKSSSTTAGPLDYHGRRRTHRWERKNPMIIVQCEHRIIVLNMRWYHSGESGGEDRRVHNPIVCSVGAPDDLSAARPSSVQPLTSDLLAIGCTDGTLRFYSVSGRRFVRTIKAHQEANTNDSIVRILAASRLSGLDVFDDDELDDGGGGSTGFDPKRMEQVAHPQQEHHRVITIGSSGLAYVWIFTCVPPKVLSASRSSSSVAVSAVRVRRPVGRMEGILVFPPSDAVPVERCMFYDAEREFFIAPVTGGKHICLWDLSTAILVHPTVHSVTPSPLVPELPPFLSIRIPNLPECVLVPAAHPSFSDATLTMYVASPEDGGREASLSSSPSPLSSSSDQGGGSRGGEIPVVYLVGAKLNSKEGQALPEIRKKFSVLPPETSNFSGLSVGKGRVYSMAVPMFRKHLVVCGTNRGVSVVELEDEVSFPSGSRHVSVGVSGGVLLVEGSSVFAATIDCPNPNPVGPLSVKSPVLVYKSIPPAVGKPSSSKTSSSSSSSALIERLSIRQPPRLLLSLSGDFVTMFWLAELRYEILHVRTLLGPRDGSTFPPPVEVGTGVTSFAWVGFDDAFAVLRAPGRYVETNAVGINTSAPTGKHGRFDFVKKSRGKGSSTPTSVASSTSIAGGDKGVAGVDHSSREDWTVELRFLVSVKAEAARITDSIAAATATSLGELMVRGGRPTNLYGGPVLCVSASSPSASARSPDHVQDDSNVLAYFYSTRTSSLPSSSSPTETPKASSYHTIGPSFPLPDLVEWSEDGTMCCVCVGRRLAIYSSQSPVFRLIGTASLAPTEVDPKVESAKFLHGVLYCTSRCSVQCIFFGDQTDRRPGGGGTALSVDSFVLASPNAISSSSFFSSPKSPSPLTPPTVPMSLNCPSIMTMYAGSLIVSTSSGIQALGMHSPLLRMATLLSAGHAKRAIRWFNAFEVSQHEELGKFLERRGYPALAVDLEGLSIRYLVDLCIKWRLTDNLVNLIDTHGLSSLRRIDAVSVDSDLRFARDDGLHGTVECVGAYLLGEGKAELVRRLASECVTSGEVEARREAFVLASLLLAVDPSDARRLVKRAIGGGQRAKVVGFSAGLGPGGAGGSRENEWPVGKFVREHFL